MVVKDQPLTHSSFRILTTMLRLRDNGIDQLDRYSLAARVRADKGTVHTALRGFISSGWVTPLRSVNPATGVPNPTIYMLTDSAPSLDELVGIEVQA